MADEPGTKHAAFHRTRLEMRNWRNLFDQKQAGATVASECLLGSLTVSFAYLISFPLPAAELHRNMQML